MGLMMTIRGLKCMLLGKNFGNAKTIVGGFSQYQRNNKIRIGNLEQGLN